MAVRFETYSKSLDDLQTDLLVVTVFETDRSPQGVAGLVDWRLNGFLSKNMMSHVIAGAFDEKVLLPLHQRLPARRLLVMGLGSPNDFVLTRARHLGFRIGTVISRLNVIDAAVAVPRALDEHRSGETWELMAETLCEASVPDALFLRWVEPASVRPFDFTIPGLGLAGERAA